MFHVGGKNNLSKAWLIVMNGVPIQAYTYST